MGRQKKSVLNQFFGESKKDVVKTEPENVENALLSPEPEDVVEEPVKKVIVTINEDDVKDLDEKFGIDVEEEIKEILKEEVESPVYEDDGELGGEKEEVQEEPKPRTIESLTYKELRFFQRTGQMPK